MKFGLHFANLTFPEPAAAHRVARAAEAAGFESLITVEHVVWPTRYDSRYPYSPDGRLPGGPGTLLPDPLIWMAHVAAATTTLRLITGVLVVPQRNPLVLAKQVATLDHLSGGRICLGIGVGWLREEFDALGVPFERRGASRGRSSRSSTSCGRAPRPRAATGRGSRSPPAARERWAVKACRARGAQRVLVPATAFLPDPETRASASGAR
jgi:hypothetical protein